MYHTFLNQGKALHLTFFEQGQTFNVVNLDLSVFIEGVIFQNVVNIIKVVVWYGDSRFQRFLMISSHLHRNFKF